MTTPLIDTHAHLIADSYEVDRSEVLARAWEAGLEAIVLIGAAYGIAGNRKTLALAETDARLFVAVGVHPHDAVRAEDRWMDELRDLVKHPKVVAIGEIGLDFFYKEYPPDVQKTWFRRQLELAHEVNLPVIFHVRDAQEATWKEMTTVGLPPRRGIFHCFSGDVPVAQEVVKEGFLLGIGGVVTFKKSASLQQVVATLPLESLVLETDCPYLAPEPYRGKRNEPAYVERVAAKIADLRGQTPAEVGQVTTENAKRIFQKP